MFLMHFSLLLCLLPFVAAHPMVGRENASRSRQVKRQNTQKAKLKQGQNTGLDPADYPDLTNMLTDAEVESTLNGLSLNDLNALNKLLDDAGNGPFDLEASLRGHHRAAKKQHYDDMLADEDFDAALSPGKQPLNDGCHEEDDLDKEKDLCTERPKCKRPTTRRCTTSRKSTTSCRSMDGFLDVNLDTGKFNDVDFKSNAKSNAFEECDPEDTMCLQRNLHRSKQRSKVQDFSDMGMNQQPTNMDSLEQLAAQAHRDESLKVHKQLDDWGGKDVDLPDSFNMDYGQLSHQVANLNDFNEMPKLGSTWSHDKVAENEGQPQLNEEEPKQAELEAPYERHLMARVAHDQQQPEKAADYKQAEETDGSVLGETLQLKAAPAVGQDRSVDELEAAEPLVDNMAANDGDSFIAKNAREPLRYLIETENGIISSENEPGEHQLRSDKEHSEMLNFESFQLSNERGSSQNQLQSKRFKRNSKKTDDAPENANESYLKKLMDSFPRDQGGQSNLNMAIRQANRAHLRIKRS